MGWRDQATPVGPAPQAPPPPPEMGLSAGAFWPTRFSPDTAGDPELTSALRVAADLERMGGPSPPRGQATPPAPPPTAQPPSWLAQASPVAQPTNPNLGNPAVFATQGQTPQGWAGPLEEAMQGAAARQNMGQIVQSNTPPPADHVPPIGQFALDNPGTFASIPFAATPIGAWRLGAGLGANLFRTGVVGAGIGGAAGGIDAVTDGGSPLEVAQGAARGAGWGAVTAAGVPLVAQPFGKAVGAAANAFVNRGAPSVSSTLGQEAQAALAGARQAGLTVNTNALLGAFQDMEQTLRGAEVAVRRSTAEKAFALLDEFREEVAQTGAVNFDDLFNIRANLRTLYRTNDEAQQRAAAAMIAEFDRAMESLPANAVMGGNPTEALTQWQTFRQTYQRAMKAEDVEVMLEVAKLAPNPDGSIVQQFRNMRTSQLRSNTWTKFWTPEEREMIESIIDGGGGFQKAATWLSRLSSGRFLGGIAGGASLATGNPAVAAGIWGAGGLAQSAARSSREQQARALLQSFGAPTQSASPKVQAIIDALSTAGGRFMAPDAADSRAAKFLEGVPQQIIDAFTGGGGQGPVRPRLVPTTPIPAY
jgi:hypothetical protein